MMNLTSVSVNVIYEVRKNGSYCDSYSNKTISDYIKYAEYDDEPEGPVCGYFPADLPIYTRYTRRQVHIIKGTLPSTEPKIHKNELNKILDKAYSLEDETTINIIFERYKDELEDILDEPDITTDEFNELLMSLSSFGKKKPPC